MRLGATVDARPIAVTRILVSIAGLIVTLEVGSVLAVIATGTVSVPWLQELSVGITGWAVGLWTILTVLAVMLLLIGLFTRAAAIATSSLFALAMVWDRQTYSNHLTLLVLLAAYLAAGNPGGAWSLDSRRLGRRTSPWWPQLLVMTQITAVYLFAGLSKINEIYLSGEILAQHLTGITLFQPVFGALAAGSVIVEVVLAFALWQPRTRAVACVVGVTMHASIAGLFGDPWILGAFGLLTVSAYPLFLTRERWTHNEPALAPISH